MAHASLRDLLPLAAGLGATAMLSFALGGLTTYWVLQSRAAQVSEGRLISDQPSTVSLRIPAIARDASPAPMPVAFDPEALQLTEPSPALESAPKPVVVPPVQAAEASPPDPQPQPKPKLRSVSSSMGFAVQVGAYLEADNARQMASQLAAQGVKARVVTWTDHSGRLWYATRVGSHDAAAAAQQEAAELSRHGFQTLVVRKVSGESS